MEENKRDYKKELENEKKIIKRYTIKVPLYMAEAFDEKLKKEGKTYTRVLTEAIEKYLKKS